MTDAIDRQAAINALHMHLMYRMGTDSNKKRLDEWINNLPSAQPKHGHWECGDDLYENAICSCCKWDSGEPWEYAWANFNFCPNCGADMRCKAE